MYRKPVLTKIEEPDTSTSLGVAQPLRTKTKHMMAYYVAVQFAKDSMERVADVFHLNPAHTPSIYVDTMSILPSQGGYFPCNLCVEFPSGEKFYVRASFPANSLNEVRYIDPATQDPQDFRRVGFRTDFWLWLYAINIFVDYIELKSRW